tara:strand:+ start:6934 stop:7197 length:264 start_codon:yes stop_codon:yes gene_type:complete
MIIDFHEAEQKSYYNFQDSIKRLLIKHGLKNSRRLIETMHLALMARLDNVLDESMFREHLSYAQEVYINNQSPYKDILDELEQECLN